MAALNGNRERRLVCLVGLVLAFGTLAAYWPVRHFKFVNLDDPLYVYQTHMVRQGLSWAGFVWAFQNVLGGNWNPLVWLSHMADCQLFQLSPGGHHLTNLLLHIANVLLLFLFLNRTTGAVWRSGFAAALFAWHPLHVESVAWVSERKDVLSTLFWLLTMLAYELYVAKSKLQDPASKIYYGVALVCFALGLMSKPMLVTLPFVLWLLDYWPLQRTQSWSKRVLDKLPFLVLSLAAGALAVWAQRKVGAIGTESLPLRLENVALSYAAYLGKLFWPFNLAVFYPYPDSISIWQALGAALLIGAISWTVIRAMGRHPYLGVGWFWFLGTLVPVIGLVQVGMQALADRYTYVPYVGLAVMLSRGMADLAAAWPRARTTLAVVAALALGGCLALTWPQVNYWRDSTALYEHALNVTSGNYLAHDNLGNLLMDQGKLDEAVKHFQAAIRLTPSVGKPYNDLGKAYALQQKMDDATAMFLKAATLNPGLALARWNLGNAWLLKGKVAEGLAELKIAVQLSPDDMEARRKYADALIKHGKAAEALPYCEAVVRAQPEDAHAHFALASACQANKQLEPALANFKEALRLAPDTPDCMNAVAWIYATSPKAEMRDGSEAVRLAGRACDLTKRQTTAILDTLAAAYAETGRFDEAIKTTGEISALALAAHDTATADTARQRLELYKAGKPCRDEQ